MNKPIRLLIIDDSAYNRRALAHFFKDHPRVEVVGKAADGQEGLQLVHELSPTIITLDLEMPRLDGFGFLRLLMSSCPIPVVIISAHSKRDNVIRALELGAIDFVAKPDHLPSASLLNIRAEVVKKVTALGGFNRDALRRLSSDAPPTGIHFLSPLQDALPASPCKTRRLVVIGASTGGPASLTTVLGALPADLRASILVVQHMPPQFTETFARRLDRLCALHVAELQGGALLHTGHVYVAAGDGDMVVTRTDDGYKAIRMASAPDALYVPSVDRLFSSSARIGGDNLLAIVLTGMGDDGAYGARCIAETGGTVLVESEETAVVYGMPRAVKETGIPVIQRPLHMIARQIVRFCQSDNAQ